MRRFSLVLLVGSFLLPAASLNAAEPQRETERLKSLLTRLGSERFADREDASRLLEQAGEPALPLLRAALTTPDLEVRRRAEDLLPRIEIKLTTAKAIVPSRVHFKCEDKSVAEAIAEFARVTGQPIQMTGDVSKLSERRITLDTGDTTFWAAFGQLCAKGGIREPETPTEQQVNPTKIYMGGRGRRLGGVRFINNSYYPQQHMFLDPTLLVEDGVAPHYPSVAAGSLRVRALLPKGRVFTDLPDGTKQVALQMEVRPEAKLEWTQLIALRIDRVLDETGRKVRHTGDFIEGGLGGNSYMDNAQLVWLNGGDLYSEPLGNTDLRHIPISLIVDGNSIRNLSELSGTLCGRVRTPPEPFVTLADLAKAVGKASQGVDGCEVKVTECKRGSDGLCQVKVELKVPLMTQTIDNMNGIIMGRMGRMGIQADPANLLLNKNDPNSVPFKVTNTKGEVLELVTGNLTLTGNNASTSVYSLVYKPGPNDTDPVKLEYIGRREVLVEVPFTLKDVPLVAKDPQPNGSDPQPLATKRSPQN